VRREHGKSEAFSRATRPLVEAVDELDRRDIRNFINDVTEACLSGQPQFNRIRSVPDFLPQLETSEHNSH
jgi:hypothetical protein